MTIGLGAMGHGKDRAKPARQRDVMAHGTSPTAVGALAERPAA